jgi:hypothetical protein
MGGSRGAVRGIVFPRLMATALPVRRACSSVLASWREREERSWLGLVGVPLGETATGLLDEWWTWLLLLFAAWAWTPSWRWSWLLAFELGFVGTTWAAIGATTLADFPENQLLVGVLWALFPLALALAGIANRRRQSGPEAYFPLR